MQNACDSDSRCGLVCDASTRDAKSLAMRVERCEPLRAAGFQQVVGQVTLFILNSLEKKSCLKSLLVVFGVCLANAAMILALRAIQTSLTRSSVTTEYEEQPHHRSSPEEYPQSAMLLPAWDHPPAKVD